MGGSSYESTAVVTPPSRITSNYLLGLGQDGDTFAVWLQIAGGLVFALVLVGALQLLEPRGTRATGGGHSGGHGGGFGGGFLLIT